MKTKSHGDGDASSRRAWDWVHFFCGFVPVGVLLFLNPGMPFFKTFWPHIAETIFAAGLCGAAAASFGERGLEKIFKSIRWW